MADEARVQSSLSIIKDDFQYQNRPVSFIADVGGRKGPTPGALTAPKYGKVVDFGELSTIGFCIIRNLEKKGEAASRPLEYGIYDPGSGLTFPFGEVWPGEMYVLRLSPNLSEEYSGTGTGTTGAGANRFFIRGVGADVRCSIEAFER